MAAASWKFWPDSSKMTLVWANFRLPNRGRPRTEPPPCRAGPAAARADEPVIAKKTGPTKPTNRGKSHDAELFARGRLRGVFVRRDERGRPAEGRLDRRQGRSRAAPRREKAPRVVGRHSEGHAPHDDPGPRLRPPLLGQAALRRPVPG